MFLQLRIIKGEEVVLQCIRCFSSFGQFASPDIVPWAVKEVVRTSSQLTVICMGTFRTYHVKMSPKMVFFFFFFSFHLFFPILILIIVELPAAFVLPSREALSLGDRVIMYLPRCADTNGEVRKVSAQVSFWQNLPGLLVS